MLKDMNFSIDTNVIIGVINHKDRLHEISLELMKIRQKEKLFICTTALQESQTVLKTKINEIVVEIIQFLPKFLTPEKLSLLELEILLIEIFKEIQIQKPNSANFLNLVHAEISSFLQKGNDVEKIPFFLTRLSLEYSNRAISKLESIHSLENAINMNFNNLVNVKQLTNDIYFKNTNDERIFQELMTNLDEVSPIVFFSDDHEFIKKSKIGYEKISNDLKYSKNFFSCELLQ